MARKATPAVDIDGDQELETTAERKLLESVPRGNGTEARYYLEADGTITREVVRPEPEADEAPLEQETGE